MKEINTEGKKYVIKPSMIDVSSTLPAMAFGIVLILVSIYGYNRTQEVYRFFVIIFIWLLFKLYIFQLIDFLFPKQIVLTTKEHMYIKVFYLK